MLTALNRLNPSDGSKFEVQRDYPRWLLTEDRRAKLVEVTIPVEARFVVEPGDQEVIDSYLGRDVLSIRDRHSSFVHSSFVALGHCELADARWWVFQDTVLSEQDKLTHDRISNARGGSYGDDLLSGQQRRHRADVGHGRCSCVGLVSALDLGGGRNVRCDRCRPRQVADQRRYKAAA